MILPLSQRDESILLRITRGLKDNYDAFPSQQRCESNVNDSTCEAHVLPDQTSHVCADAQGLTGIASTVADAQTLHSGSTRVLASYAVPGTGLALCGVGYNLSMKHGNGGLIEGTSKRQRYDAL